MIDKDPRVADPSVGGDGSPSGHARLTAATFSGMRWSYIEAIGTAGMQLIYITAMSRLLPPAVFGLMAIAFLTVNLGHHLSQMGVAQALIQRRTISSDDVRAGFTASVGLGLIFFAVLWFVAPYVASFFTEPAAVPVLRIMGAHFVVVSLGATSQGLLRRDLRFRTLALAQMSSYFLGYGIGIALAMAGAGVWSLVAGVLSANLFGSLFQYAAARHDIRPILGIRRFGDLYSYGARVSGVQLLQFFSKQLDTFAVGRYATTAMLGQYNRAFTVVSAPLSRHLAMALSRVLLPAYSRIQSDEARLKRAYLSLLTIGGAVMLSLAAGMAVAAPEIVAVLLGDQWNQATAFVPFFAFALALRMLTNFADVLAQARAALNSILTLQVLYLGVLAAAYVAVSALDNMLWFAAVFLIGELVRHLAFGRLLRAVVGLQLSEVVRAYAPAATCAVGVALAVGATQALGSQAGAPALVTLLGEVAAGALSLVVTIRINPFSEVRRELGDRLRAAGMLQTPGRAKAAAMLLGRA